MAALRPCDDLQKKAFDEANTIMNADPGVKLIMAICTPAVPGAAEAVKQSGRTDVKVIGLGLPNDNKRYVHEGITDCVVLWNTMDLGYLTVQAARALNDGTLKPRRHQLRGRPAQVDRDPGRQHPARPAVPLHQGQHRPVRFLKPNTAAAITHLDEIIGPPRAVIFGQRTWGCRLGASWCLVVRPTRSASESGCGPESAAQVAHCMSDEAPPGRT